MRQGFIHLLEVNGPVQQVRGCLGRIDTYGGGLLRCGAHERSGGGKPEIFNTEQGSQFTPRTFTGIPEARGVIISTDGRVWVYDNISVERLRRSRKYEEVYFEEYATVREVRLHIGHSFRFANFERLHQAIGYKTPYQPYVSTRIHGPGPEPHNPV